MIRIGKSTLVFLFVGFWIGWFQPAAHAQSEVGVSATVSESTAYTGERLQLTIEISGDFNNVSRPDLPDFTGFELLSSTPSTERQFQIINGRMSSSFSYNYDLSAGNNAGNYQIPPITVNIDGQNYETEPISVEIIDRNDSAAGNTENSRPDIFLQLSASDEEPVPGQQVIIDVNLFFKDGMEVTSYQPVPGWKAEGFWKEELENTTRPRAESTVFNGVRYRKARLLQFALFPTKTGELTVSPYEITVSVRSTSSRRDRLGSFFSGFGSNQRNVELESDPISIDVQPLSVPDNATLIGGVGNFNIERQINRREITSGESVEIITTITGSGNIPLLSKPGYDLPDGLEIYEPRESTSINRRDQQISGTKTYTDVVIAQNAGSYTIPETEVAYYNPDANRFMRQTLPAISFSAKNDPDAIANTRQSISTDLSPATGLANWIQPTNTNLFSLWWFWVGLLLPLLVVMGGYLRKKYLQKMETDTAFARARKADNIANEKLQEAIRLAEQGDIKRAYNMLHKALTGFIGDRFNLPEAGLSNNDYARALEQNNVDPSLIKNIRMLLDKCATISYAPDTSQAYLRSHVGLAQSILDKLKKEL